MQNFFDKNEVFKRDEEGTCKLIHFFRSFLDKFKEDLSMEGMTIEEEIRMYEERVMGVSIYVKSPFVNYLHIHVGNNIHGIKYQIFEQTLYFHLHIYGPSKHEEIESWLDNYVRELIRVTRENREVSTFLNEIVRKVKEEIEMIYQSLSFGEYIQKRVKKYIITDDDDEKLSFYTDSMIMNTRICYMIKKDNYQFTIYQSYSNEEYHTYFKKNEEEPIQRGNFKKNSEELEKYVNEILKILFFV